MELISGPDPDPESQNLWELVKEGKIDHYRLKKDYPAHFTLVDGKHIRGALLHSPTEDSWREGNSFESYSLGASLWELFDKLREKAVAVRGVTGE